MDFQKTLTTWTTQATRRLARQRASSVLLIYALVSLLIIFISYTITFSLLLYPLASISFQIFHRPIALTEAYQARAPKDVVYTRSIGAVLSPYRNESQLRLNHLNYAALPFRRPEVDLILSYLKPTDTYLEYGSSATTLTFPFFTEQTFSIEHDRDVCNGITLEMTKHEDLRNRLRAFCAEQRQGQAGWGQTSLLEEGSYRAFQSYVDFPLTNLSSHTFDKVLINGRARVACALRILPQLEESSILFFHDYFLRPKHYAKVLLYYEEVARVMAHGSANGYTDDPMGLLVLKPRKEYVTGEAEVSVERINEIYDEYEEQPPGEDSTGMEVAFQNSLSKSNEGGYNYYGFVHDLACQTTITRILLDIVALVFIVMTYLALRTLFRKVFVEALASSSSGVRASRIFGGDFRASSNWLGTGTSRTSASSTVANGPSLPVTGRSETGTGPVDKAE